MVTSDSMQLKTCFGFIFLIIFLLFFSGCENQLPKTAVIAPGDSGKQLTLQYCGGCHLPVAPEALDKKSWLNHVLPAMAPRLGIQVWNGNQYYPGTGQTQRLISFNDWTRLVEYYKKAAPDSLSLPYDSVTLKNDWFVFSLKKPAKRLPGVASTLMVAIDTFGNKIYTCDDNNDLYRWNQDLQGTQVYHLPSPAVNVAFSKNKSDTATGMFTLVGSMLAIDKPMGQVLQLTLGNMPANPDTLASTLPRPVESVAADFNKDGLTDWVVCGFGHEKGGLYWLQQSADHSFTKNIIREVPGAIQAYTGDFNHDGWPDIACLFAHADEGVWLFINDHQGGFTATNLLRFPPQYGSTSFQLVDFNNDGQLDILYTSGDNSDYSRILKPFHGVYIFLDEGKNTFRQAYFFHINGCTKAVAADFDKDGKPDIATIAFFADLKSKSSEKFICFRQDGLLHFIPHVLPLQSYGRWISMDVNDYDRDGDPDIVLGNFSKGFLNQENFKPDWDVHVPFVVLENRSAVGKR